MGDDLIQLRVSDVKVAVPAGNGVEAGLVVLEEENFPHRTLRMFIGQPEARAIHVPWSNTVPPRPSTWDLFVSTIAILDGQIDRVVITDVEEERHFFAQVAILQKGDEPILITARPSDAIALALRSYDAKIYAQAHVLDEAGVLADGTRWEGPSPEPPASEPDGSAAPEPDEPAPAPEEPAQPEDVTWPTGVEEIGSSPWPSDPQSPPPVEDDEEEEDDEPEGDEQEDAEAPKKDKKKKKGKKKKKKSAD